jgi:hypothetical protein
VFPNQGLEGELDLLSRPLKTIVMDLSKRVTGR